MARKILPGTWCHGPVFPMSTCFSTETSEIDSNANVVDSFLFFILIPQCNKAMAIPALDSEESSLLSDGNAEVYKKRPKDFHSSDMEIKITLQSKTEWQVTLYRKANSISTQPVRTVSCPCHQASIPWLAQQSPQRTHILMSFFADRLAPKAQDKPQPGPSQTIRLNNWRTHR